MSDEVDLGTDPYLTLTQSYPTMFTVAILFMVLIFVLTDASAGTYMYDNFLRKRL